MNAPRKAGKCKGPNCQKVIYWLPKDDHAGGTKLHPYDDPDGKVSHFVTCPDSQTFRAKRPSKAKE